MSNNLIHTIRFMEHSPVTVQRLAYDKKSKLIAVLRTDNSIELWSTTHKPFKLKVVQRATEGSTECMVWCQGRLFTGSLDGTVKEHCVSSQHRGMDERSRVISITGGSCWSLAANPQETMIATGSEDGHISLFELREDGLHLEKILERLQCRVLSMAWHPDGSHIVAASGGNLRICSLKPAHPRSIEVLSSSNKDRPEVVWCVEVLPNLTIVAGDSSGCVTFWHWETATLVSKVTSHKAAVLCLAQSADGEVIYAAGIDPTIRKLTRPNEGQWCASRIASELHTHDVKGLIVDDHDRVISAGFDCNLCVYFFPPKTCYSLPCLPDSCTVSCAGEAHTDLALCCEDKIQWWRLGEPTPNNGVLQDKTSLVVPLVKDRMLVCEVHCPDVACCSLNSSATLLAYSSPNVPLRILHFNKPQGDEASCSLSKVLLSADDVLVGSVKHMLWLTHQHLFTVDQHNNMNVWEVSSDLTEASVARTLTLPKAVRRRSSDEDIVAVSADSDVLATVTASGDCALHNYHTGKSSYLPHQRCRITAVDVKSKAVLAAYEDGRVMEFDSTSGTITHFGTLLSEVTGRLTSNYVITGISSSSQGNDQTLCLQSDVSLTFIRRNSILDFNWNKLPQNKKIRLDDNVKKTNQNNDVKSINGNELNKYKPKRANRYYGPKADPFEVTWKSLATVVSRDQSYIARAHHMSDGVIASVEITMNDMMSNLPEPLYAPKFGAK